MDIARVMVKRRSDRNRCRWMAAEMDCNRRQVRNYSCFGTLLVAGVLFRFLRAYASFFISVSFPFCFGRQLTPGTELVAARFSFVAGVLFCFLVSARLTPFAGLVARVPFACRENPVFVSLV